MRYIKQYKQWAKDISCDDLDSINGWTAAEEFFVPMLEEATKALEKIGCNETYHRLGGIDDCVRCKALAKIKEMKGEE